MLTDRHAGYSYSGETAAYAYKSLDLTGMWILRALWLTLENEFSFWARHIMCIFPMPLCRNAQHTRHP